MVTKTLHELHEEGRQLYEKDCFGEAAKVFRSAIERFQADRETTKSAIAELVDVAGALCMCYHAMKDWNTCVVTAHELLALYPVIPKAYAAIGMCIVEGLREQEAAQQAKDARNSPSMPPRSGEEVRQDPRRYMVKLGGAICTADDAHTYLCRSLLLSDAALQLSLGPYVETVVRWLSEQLLSAGLSLEREHGEEVLNQLTALEEDVDDVPRSLDAAPLPVAQPSFRVIDAAHLGGIRDSPSSSHAVEEVTGAEADAILQSIQAEQHVGYDEVSRDDAAATDAEAPTVNGVVVPGPPLDFFLSRRTTHVRVCHAERGGIPRGLTLARAKAPFAVSQNITLPLPSAREAPISSGPATALPGGNRERHFDPFSSGTSEEAMTAAALSFLSGNGNGDALFNGLSSAKSQPLLLCNGCGRTFSAIHRTEAAPAGCTTCEGVLYCSAACEQKYRVRHERHECALRVALQRRSEKLATAATVTAANAATEGSAVGPAGDVVPGGGWDSSHLHGAILPLCISVYSGLMADVAGAAEVHAQMQQGVQPRLRCALPCDIEETLTEWANLIDASTRAASVSSTDAPAPVKPLAPLEEDEKRCESGAMSVAPNSSGASTLAIPQPSTISTLVNIFFLVRLHSVELADCSGSAFYTERLLLRHSCEPNCVWSDTLPGIVTARFICKGEELTIAGDERFPQHWPWQIRQKWFVHHHGVPCMCARCLREGSNLNHSRGMLSNELVEQLLTADIPGHPCPTPAHQHPTHLYHRQVQKLLEQSKNPHRNIPSLLCQLDELSAELHQYLLPSHYLLEDLRRAVSNAAESEMHLSPNTTEAQNSLLFWESMWAGAIPVKRQLIRRLPTAFECTRRRKIHPLQQRRRRRQIKRMDESADTVTLRSNRSPERRLGADSPSPLASPSTTLLGEGRADGGYFSPPAQLCRADRCNDDDDEVKKAFRAAALNESPSRTPVQAPLVATKDFASGRHLVDLFYDSYQTWYM